MYGLLGSELFAGDELEEALFALRSHGISRFEGVVAMANTRKKSAQGCEIVTAEEVTNKNSYF